MSELDTSASDAVPGPEPAPPADPGGRSHRAALLTVFLVVFIDLLGFGIVLPLLPLYATELVEPLFPGRDGMARVLHGAVLGCLMASFSAMQFFFAPFWGRLSDRVGRRPILLLGLSGSVLFYALFGTAAEIGAQGYLLLGLGLMFVSRIGAGIAGATIATAQAVIADSTPPDKRSHGMALIGAAFGIGFTFGPLLGFASLFIPLEGAPGFAAAFLSLVALILAVVLFRETLRPGVTAGRRQIFDWHGMLMVLRMPTVGILVLTFFLATFAFGSLESTLALVNKLLLEGYVERAETMTREQLQTTERGNFLVFAYVGMVLMLTQGLFYRRLVQRVGEIRFLRLGVILMAAGLAAAVLLLVFFNPEQAGTRWLFVALPIISLAVIGFAFLTPSVQGLISSRSDPTRQGEVLGVNQSAAALARILGPFLGITLFFATASHMIPFLAGSLLLVVVFLLTLRIRPERKESPDAAS